MTGDDEVLREFLLESGENLNQLDSDFVALEQDPTNKDRLGGIFRCIHTIKGTSGFLGFSRLEALTHVGESLLSRVRDGELVLDSAMTSALLAMVDAVRRILASVEATGQEGTEDHTTIMLELARVGGSTVLRGLSVPPAAAMPPAPFRAVSIVPPAPQMPVILQAAAEPADVAAPRGTSVAETTVRVDVVLLDKVMNLVGELVLARNQIIQFGTTAKDAAFVKASQRLNLLTTELQEGVMKTRMQPIGNVWGKFPRVVRDLSNTCGKQIELEMDGAGTELDRTIIEAIKDPLTHAVRNAVDHGIETPAKRRAAGKPESGTLLLRAFHEGGQVNIEISDDGGGLDVARIRSRAIEREVVTAERAGRMSDREVMHLIFQPGFSTAEKVTNVSGRGVGMDVVKTNIEKIGGTVDISSRLGHGTTLKIKIPLTLAIIPALIVTSRSERFAIPQVNLLELVRLEGEQARNGIERLSGTMVYRLRGNLLPLVFLDRALELGGEPNDKDIVNIVVLQADDRQFGLVVDGISDTEEIVVKPLGKELKGISTFAGATIMGDGRVALILDVLGVAQRAAVVSATSRERPTVDKSAHAKGEGEPKETLLLFRVGETARMAIPLSMVARLEEVGRSKVEQAAGREVVQYRGAILPLVDLGRELSLAPTLRDADAPLQVIVYSEQGRSVGFVVEQILDVVEETITVRHRAARPGVLGAVVVQGKVTDLLDVHGVIMRTDPSFFVREEAA
jgi:two-component system chemotaxis sensor kinase CheA